MSTVRPLSEKEKSLIVMLLRASPDAAGLVDSLEGLVVEQMPDGGMGSLILIPAGVGDARRSFGEEIARGEFIDANGVPVSVTINVDRDGRLFELDVFKVSFAPLIAMPDYISINPPTAT